MTQLTHSKQTSDLMPEPVIMISYFFYELGQPQEKQFRSLLQAVLCTLLQTFHNTDPRALSSVMNTLEPQVCQNPGDQRRPVWEDWKLREALRQSVDTCRSRTRLLLFIDGFDECEGDHRDQLEFLRTWIESSTKSELSIKACIASRDEAEIRLRLSMYPSLPIHKFTKANIAAYVSKRLGAAWEMMSSQPGCTTAIFDQGLIDALVEKAEGVFLWVDLVITQLTLSIEEDKTVEELRMQLDDMPDGLRDLYSRILNKIPQNFLHDTINFLRLYDHSIDYESLCMYLIIKPHLFTLWEFCAAAEDPSTAIYCKAHFENGLDEENAHSRQHLCAIMKRRIQRSCRGLIHVEDTNDLPKAEVTLLHRTVKEFIIKDDSFRLLQERVDKRHFRDPELSLMAMSLRLLKVDLDYKPKWINWVSPENRESTSDLEIEEKHDCFSIRVSDIVCFFLIAAAAAARKTGLTYKLYIDELDRFLSCRRPDGWAGLYYRYYEQSTGEDWNTNLLCLAFAHRMDIYIEEEFKRNRERILDRNQRPLMCYVFDDSIFHGTPSPKMLKTLLNNNGADPNEQFQDFTPWTQAVWRIANLFEDHYVYGEDYDDSILIFQILLQHGANPTQRVYLNNSYSDSSVSWPAERFSSQTLVYTTTFHVILSISHWWHTAKQLESIQLLLRYTKDFDAADSDGTTISAWADVVDERNKEDRDPEDALLGVMVRQAITAIRERQRVHALWK